MIQKNIDASYKLMEMVTKGYHWYHDTPEQPFTYNEGSLWLINPKTQEWMLELEKSGKLWYHYKTPNTFSKYLNMEESDFQSFIKVWLEDVLKKGVVSTHFCAQHVNALLEDVLKKGVASTAESLAHQPFELEDVFKKGVVSTGRRFGETLESLEDVLSTTEGCEHGSSRVEDVLKNGKQWN